MKRTLDKSEPFGEVWGSDSGAVFEQHGIMFDSSGEELPGYEDVVIPEKDTKIVYVEGDNPALIAEIGRLSGVVATLQEQLLQKDEQFEEASGRADLAEAEVTRLKKQLVDAPGAKDSGKAADPKKGADGAKQMSVADVMGGGAG